MGLYLVTKCIWSTLSTWEPFHQLDTQSLYLRSPPPLQVKTLSIRLCFHANWVPFVSINYQVSKFHFDKEKCWFTQKVTCLVENKLKLHLQYCFVHQMNLLWIDKCHGLLSASSNIAIFQQIRKLIWCFVSFLRAILSVVSSESLIHVGAVFESKKYRDGKI